MNVNLATRLNVISFLQKFFLIWFGIWEKSLFFETFFCFFSAWSGLFSVVRFNEMLINIFLHNNYCLFEFLRVKI